MNDEDKLELMFSVRFVFYEWQCSDRMHHMNVSFCGICKIKLWEATLWSQIRSIGVVVFLCILLCVHKKKLIWLRKESDVSDSFINLFFFFYFRNLDDVCFLATWTTLKKILNTLRYNVLI